MDIALIPKFQFLKVVVQFQPVRLCNFSYKVFLKVLVNRFKPILVHSLKDGKFKIML